MPVINQPRTASQLLANQLDDTEPVQPPTPQPQTTQPPEVVAPAPLIAGPLAPQHLGLFAETQATGSVAPEGSKKPLALRAQTARRADQRDSSVDRHAAGVWKGLAALRAATQNDKLPADKRQKAQAGLDQARRSLLGALNEPENVNKLATYDHGAEMMRIINDPSIPIEDVLLLVLQHFLSETEKQLRRKLDEKLRLQGKLKKDIDARERQQLAVERLDHQQAHATGALEAIDGMSTDPVQASSPKGSESDARIKQDEREAESGHSSASQVAKERADDGLAPAEANSRARLIDTESQLATIDAEVQRLTNRRSEMSTLLSNIMSLLHQMIQSIVQNLR